jgi:hypothetical protein
MPRAIILKPGYGKFTACWPLERSQPNWSGSRFALWTHRRNERLPDLSAEKWLKIVVPYRDRDAQLRRFLPHVRQYFAANGDIRYRIVIVEQEDGLPFNRGAIKNVGFLLSGEAEYTCFHDVDYLPVSADYSWADVPTGLVWFGAESIPISSSPDTHYIRPDMPNFFGGAILIPNHVFERVDGYSNDYWGWGYEDTDLMLRFKAARIPCARRKCFFRPLFHESDGYEANGDMKSAGLANRALQKGKWAPNRRAGRDGLSTISYEILSREAIADPAGREHGPCERIKVRLKIAS